MENQQKAAYNQQAAKELGQELKKLRTQQGMDTDDAAGRLKLSAEQVEALEQGNYADFSGLVFVSGFLRAYGRLLKMDEKDLAGRLKAVVPAAADHVYAVNRQQSGTIRYQNIEKAGFPKWILGLATGLLVGSGILAWQNKSNQEHALQTKQDSSAVQNSLQPPALKASNISVSKMADENKQASAAAASQATPAAASAAAASAPAVTVAPDELWIKVHFRSNLIITDKDGKMVFSRIVPAGGEQRFKGGAPYNVWVGISSGAQANFGGKAINLQEHRAAGERSASFIAGKK
ncbi:Cro/Cl family transcriptional regulator [Neisseria chenwenguii]|uniref:Cro/Cl family transcriptional regulator n=1 Tax=Neisseria chenwenguii TaxID=1853278 RepID=A0A220S4A2_9NEIS|nr:helix-turn-helix domain-containing protein [Neisseria chenwenguii]ASK28341.1 Cro/Cl family transcriptional regulator [Neisseria chenwenguii]